MTARPKALITVGWPAAAEAAAAEDFDVTVNRAGPMTAADLTEALARYDAIFPTVTDRLDATVFRGTIRTRLLANYGVGYSHIDTAAATRHGIVVTNTPGVLTEATADLAVTLLLMTARRAGEGERYLREGRWTGWEPTQLLGTDVAGRTLGIIGFGRIGQAMARRAHHGFGMKILVQNRSAIAPEVLAAFGAGQVGSVDDLLPRCDVVSLHCPGGAANRHLIDARRLGLMKPGAILINTARGEVVDELALAAALTEGRIGGAGLDVYATEPRVPPALLAAPNTVLLPHLGSATVETRVAMGLRALANARAFFAGQEPPDRVA